MTLIGTLLPTDPTIVTLTSYCTVEEADAYLNATLDYLVWLSTDSNTKIRALNTATRQINQLRYKGTKTDESQTFQFPRNGDVTVPQDIKDACILIAAALADGVDLEIEFGNLQVASESYTNIKTTYDRSSVPEHIINGIPCIAAWRKLKPYLAGIVTVPLCRV